MPRYLHIPHTPDTARTLTLSGRNCLVVSDIVAFGVIQKLAK